MRPQRRNRANVRLNVLSLGASAAERSSVKLRVWWSGKHAMIRRSKCVGELRMVIFLFSLGPALLFKKGGSVPGGRPNGASSVAASMATPAAQYERPSFPTSAAAVLSPHVAAKMQGSKLVVRCGCREPVARPRRRGRRYGGDDVHAATSSLLINSAIFSSVAS
jgi:hypothetical protein